MISIREALLWGFNYCEAFVYWLFKLILLNIMKYVNVSPDNWSKSTKLKAVWKNSKKRFLKDLMIWHTQMGRYSKEHWVRENPHILISRHFEVLDIYRETFNIFHIGIYIYIFIILNIHEIDFPTWLNSGSQTNSAFN